MRYEAAVPPTADLVIIGGGVVGAATAFHASRAGLHPLLLEARPRLCTLTTPVSTGAYRLQFDNVEELRLVRESVEIFLHFREITRQRTYDPEIREQGYLWMTTTEEGARRQRDLAEAQRGWGLSDVELLDGDEVRRRFPFVGEEVRQARFRQRDGFLDPKQLTLGFADGSHARTVTGCRVEAFQERGGRLTGVVTQHGTVSTGRAVICAGPLSGPLASRAGVALPIRTVVRHKLVLPHEPLVPARAPMAIDEDTGAHWRPALNGAYLLFTDPSTVPSPPTDRVTPDPDFAFALMDPGSRVSVARTAPFWRDVWDRSATNWILQAGQYTMSPDHRPLIGPTAIEGLYFNGGYSGHGIMGSAAGSRILVDVLRGSLSADRNPFRLDREFTHRDLDVL